MPFDCSSSGSLLFYYFFLIIPFCACIYGIYMNKVVLKTRNFTWRIRSGRSKNKQQSTRDGQVNAFSHEVGSV